jgi:hypothetical protein
MKEPKTLLERFEEKFEGPIRGQIEWFGSNAAIVVIITLCTLMVLFLASLQKN